MRLYGCILREEPIEWRPIGMGRIGEGGSHGRVKGLLDV